jgi:hypothetical protein
LDTTRNYRTTKNSSDSDELQNFQNEVSQKFLLCATAKKMEKYYQCQGDQHAQPFSRLSRSYTFCPYPKIAVGRERNVCLAALRLRLPKLRYSPTYDTEEYKFLPRPRTSHKCAFCLYPTIAVGVRNRLVACCSAVPSANLRYSPAYNTDECECLPITAQEQ